MKAYIAGPLFNERERKKIEGISSVCKSVGIKVYVPHLDGGLHNGKGKGSKFFKGDLAAIDESDLVIAVLDGPVVDSGASFEIGYSFAKRIPCIGFMSKLDKINLMIDNGIVSVVHDEKELRRALVHFSSGMLK